VSEAGEHRGELVAMMRHSIEEGVRDALHPADPPVAFVLVTWHESGRTGCSYSTFPKLIPEQTLVDQVACVLVERVVMGKLDEIAKHSADRPE
jgi:hypothetical protein